MIRDRQMRARDLIRYCHELGWHDPPELAEPAIVPKTSAADARDLDQLSQLLAECARCRLSEQRKTIVFGEGDSDTDLVLIGEGPGAEEDRTGRPFVGQAGQLLDEMIFALGFERRQVYIGNVVKCRPPGNRDPQHEEMVACSEFLDRQIDLIRPRVIVALGRVAARRLTGSDKPMGALRGRWTSYRGIALIPLFHPAYLLRNEMAKRSTWQDLKKIRQRLDENS